MKIAFSFCRLLTLTYICVCLASCDEFAAINEKTLPMPEKTQQSPFFYPLDEKQIQAATATTVYVPVYSNIFVSGGGKLNMAITLSVRNTDFLQPLIVHEVGYYNSAGKLIETYLKTPYLLEAMASTHFFVMQTDSRGGVGANFIVRWSAQQKSNKPVIEAVMAGSKGTHGIAFVNQGVQINGP